MNMHLRERDIYARTILHHLAQTMHVDCMVPGDFGGRQAMVSATLPVNFLEFIELFDIDGDEDLELVSEDEGATCEDEGAMEGI